jgi:hypothetical protein
MNITDDLVLWIAWMLVAGLLCHLSLQLLHKLSPEIRDRRKRRRNYGRVVARGRRPLVMLNVHPPGKAAK